MAEPSTAAEHRTEAARLARESERHLTSVYGRTADATTYAQLAQVHLGLAAQLSVTEDTAADTVAELEALREAARAVVVTAGWGSASSSRIEARTPAMERLRKLVTD